MLNDPYQLLLVFQSILIFQVVYILFQWFFIRGIEYFYYLGYMAITSIYVFLQLGKDAGLYKDSFIEDYYPYLTNSLPIAGFFLYYRFARYFVDLRTHYPRLRNWVIGLEYLLLCYVIIELIFRSIGVDQEIIDNFYLSISLMLFISSLLIIISFLRKRVIYTYFIVCGALIINFGAFGSFIILRNNELATQTSAKMYPFMPYIIASIAELICFTTGLAYKARKHIAEKNEVKLKYINELNQKLDLKKSFNESRDKIAAELHEKVGNILGSIEIQSNFAMKAQQRGETDKATNFIFNLNKLSKQGHDITDELIWSINPKIYSIQHLLDKLNIYCSEILAPSNIYIEIASNDYTAALKPPRENLLEAFRMLKCVLNCEPDKLPNFVKIDVEFKNENLIFYFNFPFNQELITKIADHFGFIYTTNTNEQSSLLHKKITIISD